MNPEMPQMPQDELEASLTALLLGELPHEQAAALHQKLAQDAELAKLYERLKQTVNLVRETVASPAAQAAGQPAPLKLSNQRREKLLQHFKTVAPKAFAKPRRRRMPWLVPVAAAAALVMLLASIMLPNFTKARSTAHSTSILNNLRQLDGAKQQWALDNHKSASDVVTLKDLEPYLRGDLSSRESSVAGEAYIVGRVGEPATAEIGADKAKKLIRGRLAPKPADQRRADRIRLSSEGEMSYVDRNGPVVTTAPVPVPPPPAPAPARPAGMAIVLPESSELADATGTAPVTEGVPTAAPMAVPLVPSAGAPEEHLTLGVVNAQPAPGLPSVASAPPGAAPVAGFKMALESLQTDGRDKTAGALSSAQETAINEAVSRQAVRRPSPQNPPAFMGTPRDTPVPVLGDVPVVGQLFQSTLGAARESVKDKIESSGTLSAGVFDLTNAATQDVYNWALITANSFAAAPAESATPHQFYRMLSQQGTDANGASRMAQSSIVLPQAQPEQGLTRKDVNGIDVQLFAEAGGIKAPEGRSADHDEKVREAQKKVDGLRAKLNISDAVATGNGPSPLMTANTVRKLEELRMENKAELVRQQTLVDRLKEQGNEQDAEKLAARVLSLSNNLDNLEKEVEKATANDVAKADVTPLQITLAGITTLTKPATPPVIPQPEVQTAENAFSTFSLNVSDVSFKLAAASLENGVMPEPATVRSEEFINAFDYRDPEPPPGVPVAFAWERARYPFAQNRDLLRFSIKTAAAGRQPGRPLNLVLLLDNSGSMERADRVRIIHEALRVLAGQLQAQDKFSVVTFARTAHLWVDGVPGSQAAQVAEEVSGLTPQGGTNLEDAMNLAYQTALRHYLANGINRVVLLTDGAANLGNVEPEALKQKVEANRKQGVALDCFGIGWEGYNDDLLEVLSRNGDGRYAFINTPEEAGDEFAAKLAGALQVAASDVKVQVEFNPGRVTAYRQIGYAKHQLSKEQFRDNTVNAAQIGAAEAGNALYAVEVNPNGAGPLCTVRVRFRIPGTEDYREHAWDVPYNGNAVALEQASPAMRLAATGSAFAEWLASSPYAAEVTPDRLLGYLSGVPEVYGADARPKKLEWMLRQAKSIAGK
jgi:Mg-chelatase subunit ChlD